MPGPLPTLPPRLRAVLAALPVDLQEHTARVRTGARDLAAVHRLDADCADLAAAAHDIARADAGDVLLAEAETLGVPISDADWARPMLLHGPVGAGRLQGRLGVTAAAVVEAVRWHTTGHATMGAVAKVVFLADKFDLAKAARYPHIERVKELAAEDMDRAIIVFLQGDLVRLLQEGAVVHPGSLATLNGLLRAQARV